MSQFVHVASPVQPNGEVHCYKHPEEAIRRMVSHTAKNPNRAFYSCNVREPDGESCKFFKWEDEIFPLPEPSAFSPYASPPPSQNLAMVSQLTPPLTPRKRPAPVSVSEESPLSKRSNLTPDASPSTPREEARKARLNAMLRAQGLPAEEQPAIHSPSPRDSSKPQLSTRPSWFPAQRSTPPLTAAESTEAHQWPPQTPSPSSRDRSSAAKSDVSSRNSTTGNSASSEIRYGINRALGSPLLEDPFTSPSGSGATESGGSAPRGGVAPYLLTSAEARGRSPADLLMDATNRAAVYIQQLELKVTAAEESNDAKAKKIATLEEELEKLQSRNAQLESALADMT